MDNLLWYHLGKQHGGGGSVETEAPSVPLNMEDGDQIVMPSEGKLLSQVTIEKPDTLRPENIAEGIDIAGIIGTLAAGGGGGEFKFFSGSFNLSSWSWGGRVNLDIGFAPDILMVYLSSDITNSTAYYGYFWYGESTAYAAKIGRSMPHNMCIGGSSTKTVLSTFGLAIESAKDANIPLTAVDATGFNLGTRNPATKVYYNVMAIGGLA